MIISIWVKCLLKVVMGLEMIVLNVYGWKIKVYE